MAAGATYVSSFDSSVVIRVDNLRRLDGVDEELDFTSLRAEIIDARGRRTGQTQQSVGTPSRVDMVAGTDTTGRDDEAAQVED